MKKFILHIAFGIFLLPSLESKAQTEEGLTRILFILDASSSMNTSWDRQPKIDGARSILSQIVDSLKPLDNVQMALRVYGHQSNQAQKDCTDSRLEVGFRKGNHNLIKNKIKNVIPKGITPIAYSLEKSEKDFPKYPEGRNIIILITDGEESCEGDPCAVSLALQKNKVTLKPFIIGIGKDLEDIQELKCIGNYYNASTPAELKSLLSLIISKVLDKTTVQVNLLDVYHKPTETEALMTFYNRFTEDLSYAWYHSFDSKGLPDTLIMDPLSQYDFDLHTLPPLEKDSIVVMANIHNQIDMDAPQGYLEMKMANIKRPGFFQQTEVLVRRNNSLETMHPHMMNATEKYLVGTYDLEVLTLPRIKLNDVKIDQSKTTTIQLPSPGFVSFSSGLEVYGGIFVKDNKGLTEIFQLSARQNGETLLLQPGNYKVIYRFKPSRDMDHTKEKNFTVKSGESLKIKL